MSRIVRSGSEPERVGGDCRADETRQRRQQSVAGRETESRDAGGTQPQPDAFHRRYTGPGPLAQNP